MHAEIEEAEEEVEAGEVATVARSVLSLFFEKLAVTDDFVEVAPKLRTTPLFPCPALVEKQQPAQPAVGGAIDRIDQEHRVVAQVEATADDRAHPGHLGRLIGAHDPGQGAAVAERQRLDPAQRRLAEQVLAAAGAAQEGEVAGDRSSA